MVKNCRLIELTIKGDDRGSLIPLESNGTVPFNIKRVYYIFDTKPGVHRGLHAHRTLQQVAISVHGECSFLVDDGTRQHVYRLDRPTLGLYVGGMVWREMFDFSPDCVLMVLADRPYSEGDYIRSRSQFVQSLK